MDGLADQDFRPRGRARAASDSRRVIAFTDDAELSETLARLADGTAIPWIDVRSGGLEAARGGDLSTDEMVLLDISCIAEAEALAAVRALSGTAAGVVAIGRDNDVGLYRALLSAGARDYLVKPIEETALADALAPAPEPAPPGQHAPSEGAASATARINLVIGARGGVGASTLAVDAAWWAAERLGVQTALVDYDLQFGACALALDLMPGRGLRDALESPERIDSLFVGSAMMPLGDQLYVLAAEEAVEEELFVAPDAPAQLLTALSDDFRTVIADVPRSMAAANPAMLARADSVTLISDLTLLGLRDALRLKKLCAERAPHASVALALRQPAAGRGALDAKEFARGYGAAPDWVLPSLSKLAGEAAGQGKPLVSLLRRRHPLAKAVAAIAERCVDPAGVAPPSKAGRKRKWLI